MRIAGSTERTLAAPVELVSYCCEQPVADRLGPRDCRTREGMGSWKRPALLETLALDMEWAHGIEVTDEGPEGPCSFRGCLRMTLRDCWQSAHGEPEASGKQGDCSFASAGLYAAGSMVEAGCTDWRSQREMGVVPLALPWLWQMDPRQWTHILRKDRSQLKAG